MSIDLERELVLESFSTGLQYNKRFTLTWYLEIHHMVGDVLIYPHIQHKIVIRLW